MIYADLSHTLKEDEKITLHELKQRCAPYDEKTESHLFRIGINGKRVLNLIGDTERYSACVIYNYRHLVHDDPTELFVACMIDLPDKTTCVVFMGTDERMIGWKEDFYLSYKKIASQEDSVEYLNTYCNSLFGKYRIMGHSKGGHLALYSAVHCKPSVKNKIISVISNDGPGLMPGSYDPDAYYEIADRYTLIVPEKDGIGTIFEMPSEKIIASVSTMNLAEAHGIMNWHISGNRILSADEESYATDKTRMALDRMIRESTAEEKEIFTEEVFKAFEEAGINTVSDLAQGGLPVIWKTIRELSEIDSVAKEMAILLAKTFSVSLASGLEIPKTVSEKADDIRSSVSEKAEDFRSMAKDVHDRIMKKEQ